MPKAVITVGISASGKTTWARTMPNYQILCRDDVRAQILYDNGLMGADEPGVRWDRWNWKWEKEVTQWIDTTYKALKEKGADIIFADTNLNHDRRNALVRKLTEDGYEVTIQNFPITFEEACKRDALRNNGVGYPVIAKQYEQWLEYLELTGVKEPYVGNNMLPAAIIVDIDGTLAHMDGRRGPFEWDKVGLDSCDRAVAEIVRAMDNHYVIIVVSGRDSVCRAETEQWLESNDIPYDHLYMRPAQSTEKDTLVKRMIFDVEIRPNYNVIALFDDRPSVCRMWREMGLKVMQVGNPYVEF